MTFHRLLFLLTFVSVSTFAGAAKSPWNREWNLANGEVWKAELVESWGPLLFFRKGKKFGSLEIKQLADEERSHVQRFVEEQASTRDIPWNATESKVWKQLKDKVFLLGGEETVSFEAPETREPDFYLCYFGASWCGPCRRFMPEFLTRHHFWVQNGFDNFATLFVSWDRSDSEQFEYYRDEGMPFLLVDRGTDKRAKVLRDVRPSGIPCLVVLDREGNCLYHTYRGEEYLGPTTVLDQFEQLLYQSNPDNPIVVTAKLEQLRKHIEKNRPWGDTFPTKLFHGLIDDRLLTKAGVDELRLILTVARQGHVKAVESETPLSPDAQKIVEKAAKQWYFIPAMADGKYIESRVLVPIQRASNAAPKGD